MSIYVINAGIGNVGAVMSMLKRIGRQCCLIDAPCCLEVGDRVILPGVGSFDAGMDALVAGGFHNWLRDVAAEGHAVLGISLGMQLLFEGSEEGKRPGLGLLSGKVVRLPRQEGLRLPHMGWNLARPTRKNPILPPGDSDQRFYFVHSYCVNCSDTADELAVTDYGIEFTSAVGRGNVFGVQFHPEKSHRFGKAMLDRFATAPLSTSVDLEVC